MIINVLNLNQNFNKYIKYACIFMLVEFIIL